jgi:dTDP-4-amino-4,6-dideoxygalactose transaminase
VATANVVELAGATPVFVDVDLDTFDLDASRVEAAITPRTRVLLPVHEFGLMADMAPLLPIAARHGLAVVEDAACALGARRDGTVAGALGAFGSFSLHPRKAITSGEGGILTTNDPALARSVRALRNHGIDPDVPGMDFVVAGFNYRLTDFQAALAASQLPRLEAAITRRAEIAAAYRQLLRNPRIRLPVVPAGVHHTFQTFHVLLDPAVDRAALIARLKEAGVGSNYGAQCIPAQTHYRRRYGHESAREFPNAWRAYTTGLAIPMYEKMSDADVERVAETLNRLA